jgi:hypothetical protein
LENRMQIKLLAGLPALALLAACGGSSNNNVGGSTAAPVVIPTGAAAGSVTLAAGQTAGVSTEDVLAVDFNSSAVGAVVELTDGELEGIKLIVQESVGGLKTVVLEGTEGGDAGDYDLVVAENLNLYVKASLNILGVEEERQFRISEDGDVGYTEYNERSRGTTTRSTYYSIIYTDDDTSLEASAESAEMGNDETIALGVIRNNDDAFEAPTGEFSYVGPTDVFIRRADDSDTDPYRTTNSQMSVDFGDNTGSYSASGFEGVDPDLPERVISVQSDFAVNSTTGTLSGSDGTASVDGTNQNFAIEGAFSPNADAVAGIIVPQAGDLEAGIFIMESR